MRFSQIVTEAQNLIRAHNIDMTELSLYWSSKFVLPRHWLQTRFIHPKPKMVPSCGSISFLCTKASHFRTLIYVYIEKPLEEGMLEILKPKSGLSYYLRFSAMVLTYPTFPYSKHFHQFVNTLRSVGRVCNRHTMGGGIAGSNSHTLNIVKHLFLVKNKERISTSEGNNKKSLSLNLNGFFSI